jgi:hypothetical protein
VPFQVPKSATLIPNRVRFEIKSSLKYIAITGVSVTLTLAPAHDEKRGISIGDLGRWLSCTCADGAVDETSEVWPQGTELEYELD